MNENDQIIKEYYAALPEDIKKYVDGLEWKTKTSVICQQNKITENQSGLVVTEVFLILLGMEKASHLTENIQKEVGTPIVLAQKIAQEVLAEIPADIKQFSEEAVDAVDNYIPEKTPGIQAKTQPQVTVSQPNTLTSTPSYGIKPLSVPTPQKSSIQPEHHEAAAPTNLPTDYHDPMPIKVTPQPEKKPLIDTMLTNRVNMPRQEASIVPQQTGPASTPQTSTQIPIKKVEVKPAVEKALTEGDKYVGQDPYRETPEP